MSGPASKPARTLSDRWSSASRSQVMRPPLPRDVRQPATFHRGTSSSHITSTETPTSCRCLLAAQMAWPERHVGDRAGHSIRIVVRREPCSRGVSGWLMVGECSEAHAREPFAQPMPSRVVLSPVERAPDGYWNDKGEHGLDPTDRFAPRRSPDSANSVFVARLTRRSREAAAMNLSERLAATTAIPPCQMVPTEIPVQVTNEDRCCSGPSCPRM